MATILDGPVGMRFRSQNVQNKASDQDKVINLLAQIPSAQGGQQENWTVAPLNGGDGSCPGFVVDAIWNFQSFWQARGVCRVVDGVIDPGKTALRKMDELAGNGPAPVDPPGPDNTQLPLDILVRFTGGEGALGQDKDREDRLKSAFNTPAYLQTHQPMHPICCTGFREQEAFVGPVVAEVLALRQDNSQGVTIVIGSSAGGVSALKTASQLSANAVRLTYVAINDAAFYAKFNEILFQPTATINLAAVIQGNISADSMENYFQTLGNEWLHDSRSPTGYMDGTEFHGPLVGFMNVSLHNTGRVLAVKAAYGAAQGAAFGNLPVGVRKQFAKLVHREAGTEADNMIWPRIRSLIKP